MGETKPGDIPAAVRMDCYKALIEKYFVASRTMLSVMPAAMRYAGPREAILHAIVRKNYGCTHFIVGRDHAGVGNYYGSYDAQNIFDEIEMDESRGGLGMTIFKFEHTHWSKAAGGMVSPRTFPKIEGDAVSDTGAQRVFDDPRLAAADVTIAPSVPESRPARSTLRRAPSER